MPLPFILDTDIGTDVDDALALAFALRHPDLDLRAVTTVSGDTGRRARIAKKLLLIAGRGDIEVAAGERGEQSQPLRSAEAGHEDAMLGDTSTDLPLAARDAVTLLLDACETHSYEIATVGMQSNIAAALERAAPLARAKRRPRYSPLCRWRSTYSRFCLTRRLLRRKPSHTAGVTNAAVHIATNTALPIG